ncbi:MAG: DNA polymerase III subunit alpha [Pseudomonadota bacterium]
MASVTPLVTPESAPAPTAFVHLKVHSEYSLVDGLADVESLAAGAAELGMPALALTEQGNLFSLVKFYRAAMKHGVKPIIGLDGWLASTKTGQDASRLTLLCQSADGYRRLAALSSRSYREGQVRGTPSFRGEWFDEGTDGLLALAGGPEGLLGRAILANDMDGARAILDRWVTLFPDRFYIDVQRTGRDQEDIYLDGALELAIEFEVPVVATNDVRFVRASDFDAHEARVCIHEGRTLADPRRPKTYSEEQYLRSPDEMIALFDDLPEALENTVEVAKRCNVELTLGTDFLPEFPVPTGYSIDEWFTKLAEEGLDARLASLPAMESRTDYDERLEYELGVIRSMGFSGYYLIVADFIQWARDNGVPVGPGRGSGAGSLAAYALGITDLDPIAFDLLFERFLNPERVSMPDFDIDFCMSGRDRVIDYVAERYGADHVSQIITFGTMAAKAVVRDVGRVLGHPYGFVDQLAKMVPFEIGMTLEKALAQEEPLRQRYEQDEEVRTLIDLARSLEGVTRNVGKHAGGVVIAPGPLTDFTPLYCEQGATRVVTQLDMDDVASVGLVKFDFLGLKTLTIIDWALKAIAKRRDETIELEHISVDDEKTFDLIKAGMTTAVFQLESRGMRDLIRRLQPDSFEDIIALVALFRPGPLQSGMVDDFIERKHGRAKVEYPHPDLEPILKPTYGVILYQEQVMQIARVLAGYSLGGADILRKAMGKKQPAEMAKQREVFVSGALAREVDEGTATYIFDLMEKFAGYGFNRSHSAAYALIAYQTAWLKAHYPSEFMAAVMSADMDNTDKVVVFIEDSRAQVLTLEPPDVNRCHYAFTAERDDVILYGLGAIKGVGEGAIESVVNERAANGPFADLSDFVHRIDSKKVNRRAIEAMIRAGAMDGFGETRSTHMQGLTRAMQAAEQYGRAASVGQNDLFSADEPAPLEALPSVPEWDEDERLLGEKETLGLYLTGHPITRHEGELSGFTSGKIASLRPNGGGAQMSLVAGLVVGVRTIKSRKGKMAIVTLDDRSGRMEIVVYSDTYASFRDVIVKDQLLVAHGELGTDEMTGECAMVAKSLYGIEGARAAFARSVTIAVDAERAGNGFVEHLASCLSDYPKGPTPIWLEYQQQDAQARIALGAEWRMRPSDALVLALRELAGEERVTIVY